MVLHLKACQLPIYKPNNILYFPIGGVLRNGVGGFNLAQQGCLWLQRIGLSRFVQEMGANCPEHFLFIAYFYFYSPRSRLIVTNYNIGRDLHTWRGDL